MTKTIKITAEVASKLEAVRSAGKTPWVIINDDYLVAVTDSRSDARALKTTNNFAGQVVKADEIEFEVLAPVAPIGAEVTGDVHSYCCPHCGVNLQNGYFQHGDEVNGKPLKLDSYEFGCMACEGEFGLPIKSSSRKAPTKKVEHTNESTVASPCKLVWEIADQMKGARRKDVIAEAQKQGVAFYTARTQYQLWLQCQKEMAAREAKQAQQGE